jgi:hypothetical protein
MFRSLCPPAFGPAKRSQNFGPFRTAFPHFRRFAFRFRSLGTPHFFFCRFRRAIKPGRIK